MYVWKILEGITPNCGLEETTSERRGREVKINIAKGSGKIKSIREGSFKIHGARLFNSLPKHIRNLTKVSTDEFKESLDQYLQLLPDEPKLPGYIPSACNQVNANPSNSIIDQSKSVKTRRPGWGVICRGDNVPPFVICYFQTESGYWVLTWTTHNCVNYSTNWKSSQG